MIKLVGIIIPLILVRAIRGACAWSLQSFLETLEGIEEQVLSGRTKNVEFFTNCYVLGDQ